MTQPPWSWSTPVRPENGTSKGCLMTEICMAPLSLCRDGGVPNERRPTGKRSLEQPAIISIVVGQYCSFKQRSRWAGQETEDPIPVTRRQGGKRPYLAQGQATVWHLTVRIYKFARIYENHHLIRCQTITLCWIPSSSYGIGAVHPAGELNLHSGEKHTPGERKPQHKCADPAQLASLWPGRWQAPPRCYSTERECRTDDC